MTSADITRANLRELADRIRADVDADPARDADTIAERIASAAAGIAGGEYRPQYNGHPNRETWNAALWIGNEEPMYRASVAIVRDAFRDYEEPAMLAEIRAGETPAERAASQRRGAIADAADALRDWYDEAIDAPTDGPAGDIVGYALACVDWRDIAGDIADEAGIALDTTEHIARLEADRDRVTA